MIPGGGVVRLCEDRIVSSGVKRVGGTRRGGSYRRQMTKNTDIPYHVQDSASRDSIMASSGMGALVAVQQQHEYTSKYTRTPRGS